MTKVPLIILSALLAAAIIFGIVTYRQAQDTKGILQMTKENLSGLNVKLAELKEANSQLKEQLRSETHHSKEFKETLERLKMDLITSEKDKKALEDELASGKSTIEVLQTSKAEDQSRIQVLESALAKGEEEFENARAEIAQLEFTIAEKGQSFSQLGQKLSELRNTLDAEEEAKESLKKDLASGKATIVELRRQLQNAQSQILLLENGIAKGKTQTAEFKHRLAELKTQMISTENRLKDLKSTYEVLISDLKEEIENREVTIQAFEEKLSLTFLDRILFEFGQSSLNPEGKKILSKLGGTLRSVHDKKIRVIGHTDNVPISKDFRYKYRSNWELSADRAAAVVRFLQEKKGLDPANMEAVGQSFYHPVASNATAKGREQNRRVEIMISPRLE